MVIVPASLSDLILISKASFSEIGSWSVRLKNLLLSRASLALDTSSLRKTSLLLYRLLTIMSISLSTCKGEPVNHDWQVAVRIYAFIRCKHHKLIARTFHFHPLDTAKVPKWKHFLYSFLQQADGHNLRACLHLYSLCKWCRNTHILTDRDRN